ncbi:extracellular solute-binding protein [Cohnella silvisoli]|uniref:Extracellular solute-binding protein n=1 Tax=Cohnella silvisoli TaxID=2873699 RepID=A0ABV1KNS8_9BACL|nr:extracellular solute-binding protein [Cohnella silvisoli]MCD9020956.1 extracellular solute-binding protein [Cohnella silvisoli]
MKKWLCSVVAIVMTVTLLSACGSGNKEEAGGSASSGSGKKQLNILMESVPDTDIVKKEIAKFTKETGIAVNIEAVNYSAMHEKLVPQLVNSSSSYDLIVVDNYWVGEFTSAGWLEPLDTFIQRDKFDTSVYLKSMFDMVGQVDGTTYMLPFYNYAMSLIYRKDVFEDADLKSKYQAEFGREMKIPDTLEEYVNISKFITKQKGDKMYGSVMMGLRPDPISVEWLNYLYSSGGDIYGKDGKPVINNESGIKALDLYIDNMNNAAPKGSAGFGFDEAFNVFAQGNAASFITYNWMLAKLNNESESKVAGKVDIASVPGGTSLNGGWGWAIPKNAEDKEASWKFLKWIESFDIAKDRALQGGSPTRKDVFADDDVLGQYQYYVKVQKVIDESRMIPIISEAPQLIEILGRELSEAVSGGKTSKDALDTVAKEVQDLK